MGEGPLDGGLSRGAMVKALEKIPCVVSRPTISIFTIFTNPTLKSRSKSRWRRSME